MPSKGVGHRYTKKKATRNYINYIKRLGRSEAEAREMAKFLELYKLTDGGA